MPTMLNIGTTGQPDAGQILRFGALTTVVAAAINLVLFVFSSTFTFPPTALTPMGTPVTVPMGVIVTLLAGILETIAYLILTRIFIVKTSRIILWVLAAVMLLVLAFTPFRIVNVRVIEIAMLEVMFLVASLLPAWRLAQI